MYKCTVQMLQVIVWFVLVELSLTYDLVSFLTFYFSLTYLQKQKRYKLGRRKMNFPLPSWLHLHIVAEDCQTVDVIVFFLVPTRVGSEHHPFRIGLVKYLPVLIQVITILNELAKLRNKLPIQFFLFFPSFLLCKMTRIPAIEGSSHA